MSFGGFALIRVVLVRPEHDLNVGSVARAMKNFGCTELYIVDAQCPVGFDAVMFAKHSKEVLDNAVKVKTLKEALEGCNFAIATTGTASRYRSKLKNLLPFEQAAEKIDVSEKTAIVFGGESRGLNWRELSQCDVSATIPTSPEHHVLNLSHAVAVCLYELFRQDKIHYAPCLPRRRLAARAKREDIAKLFSEIVHSLPVVHYPEKVATAFRNVLERARPTEEEAQALYAPLGPLYRYAKKIGDFGTGIARSKKKKRV